MKIKRVKIFSFAALFLLLFSFTLCGLKSNAAGNTFNPGGDLTRYDTKWELGDTYYWVVNKKWYFGTKHKTRIFLRIVDSKNEFIDNITRIEATFYVGGKLVYSSREYKEPVGSKYDSMPWSDAYSEEGFFTNRYACTEYTDDQLIEKFKDSKKPYQECNYVWSWNYIVNKFETLYVWYLNSSGEEVAASMYDEGAHPKYDSKGNFLGFYDSEDNLMAGYTISNNGHLVTPDEMEVSLVEKQKQAEVVVKEETTIEKFISSITGIVGVIVLVLVIVGTVKIINLFSNLLSKKGN